MALVNVIRAVMSEIEDYERVSMNVQPGITVYAPAVNDLVHLLAELAENAAALSPADTPVFISGRRLATGGVLVDIIDQGFGMSAEEMAHANWRLENSPANGYHRLQEHGLVRSRSARRAAWHQDPVVSVRLSRSQGAGLASRRPHHAPGRRSLAQV